MNKTHMFYIKTTNKGFKGQLCWWPLDPYFMLQKGSYLLKLGR